MDREKETDMERQKHTEKGREKDEAPQAPPPARDQSWAGGQGEAGSGQGPSPSPTVLLMLRVSGLSHAGPKVTEIMRLAPAQSPRTQPRRHFYTAYL